MVYFTRLLRLWKHRFPFPLLDHRSPQLGGDNNTTNRTWKTPRQCLGLDPDRFHFGIRLIILILLILLIRAEESLPKFDFETS